MNAIQEAGGGFLSRYNGVYKWYGYQIKRYEACWRPPEVLLI